MWGPRAPQQYQEGPWCTQGPESHSRLWGDRTTNTNAKHGEFEEVKEGREAGAPAQGYRTGTLDVQSSLKFLVLFPKIFYAYPRKIICMYVHIKYIF